MATGQTKEIQLHILCKRLHPQMLHPQLPRLLMHNYAIGWRKVNTFLFTLPDCLHFLFVYVSNIAYFS